MAVMAFKRGDTARPLVINLAYSDGTTPDLSSSTARLIAQQRGIPGLEVINAPATLSASAFTARYDWQEEDVATVRELIAEVEVTTGDVRETFPARGYVLIQIVPDLGDIPTS